MPCRTEGPARAGAQGPPRADVLTVLIAGASPERHNPGAADRRSRGGSSGGRSVGSEEPMTMGSATEQGELWGARAREWAEYQEAQTRSLKEAMLEAAQVGPGTRF